MISLGQHAPTEGYCQTWAGVRIDEGHFGDVDLAGINFGLMARHSRAGSARGNWTAALFVDDAASIYAVKALTRIFTGKAGGSTGLLKILVGAFLGVRRSRSSTRSQDGTRIFQIEKIIEGAVKPMRGEDKGETGRHPQQLVLDRARHHRRARRHARACALFGRNWNFDGRSAEICGSTGAAMPD